MSDKEPQDPQGHRFYFLGAALLVLAGLYPILGLGRLGLTVWTVTFWVVLLAAIHAASLGPNVRRVARALGAIALAAGIAGILCYQLLEGMHGWVFVVVDALTLLFLVFATGAVLFEVLRAARVSVDHLVGGSACSSSTAIRRREPEPIAALLVMESEPTQTAGIRRVSAAVYT